MSEKALLLAGCSGMAAAVAVHAGAWLGEMAGFPAILVLLVGGVLVWGLADKRVRSTSGGRGGELPNGVPQHFGKLARWADVAITVYAAAYFIVIVYVRFVRHSCPTLALRAQLSSVVAFALYFHGTVLSWRSERVRGAAERA